MVDASHPIDAPTATPNSGHRTARVADIDCTLSNMVPRDNLNDAQYRALRADFAVWTEPASANAANDSLCTPSTKSTGFVSVTPIIGTRNSCLIETVSDWQLVCQVPNVNVTVSSGCTSTKPGMSMPRDQLAPARRAIVEAGLFR